MEAKREAQGLSLRQIASQLGLAPSTLTRIRQGQRPDAEALAVLMAWVGVTPIELLAADDPAIYEGKPGSRGRVRSRSRRASER